MHRSSKLNPLRRGSDAEGPWLGWRRGTGFGAAGSLMMALLASVAVASGVAAIVVLKTTLTFDRSVAPAAALAAGLFGTAAFSIKRSWDQNVRTSEQIRHLRGEAIREYSGRLSVASAQLYHLQRLLWFSCIRSGAAGTPRGLHVVAADENPPFRCQLADRESVEVVEALETTFHPATESVDHLLASHTSSKLSLGTSDEATGDSEASNALFEIVHLSHEYARVALELTRALAYVDRLASSATKSDQRRALEAVTRMRSLGWSEESSVPGPHQALRKLRKAALYYYEHGIEDSRDVRRYDYSEVALPTELSDVVGRVRHDLREMKRDLAGLNATIVSSLPSTTSPVDDLESRRSGAVDDTDQQGAATGG